MLYLFLVKRAGLGGNIGAAYRPMLFEVFMYFSGDEMCAENKQTPVPFGMF